jgi:hypothetical protein
MARVQHLGQIERGACRTRLKPVPRISNRLRWSFTIPSLLQATRTVPIVFIRSRIGQCGGSGIPQSGLPLSSRDVLIDNRRNLVLAFLRLPYCKSKCDCGA